MNLTPWFPRGSKPVRVGVYMQMSGSGSQEGFQYWDGERWGIWKDTPELAFSFRHVAANMHYQDDQWRGLAKKP